MPPRRCRSYFNIVCSHPCAGRNHLALPPPRRHPRSVELHNMCPCSGGPAGRRPSGRASVSRAVVRAGAVPSPDADVAIGLSFRRTAPDLFAVQARGARAKARLCRIRVLRFPRARKLNDRVTPPLEGRLIRIPAADDGLGVVERQAYAPHLALEQVDEGVPVVLWGAL